MNELKKYSAKIRKNLIEMLVPKESHHIGCSLSIVDILTYLYFSELTVYPQSPKNKNRDIFILSKGHAGAALYATLFEKGFMSKKMLMSYDRNGGILPEHASVICPGVELSTGSLGHALAVGIGFALSFRNDKKKNSVYVLLSDGELDEGSNWEGIMFAGFHKLCNITVIVDANGLQGYASGAEMLNHSDIAKRVAPFGWNTYICDGHDFTDIHNVFKQIHSRKNIGPNFIIAHTIKGKGVPYFEGKFESHYQSLSEEVKKEILTTL